MMVEFDMELFGDNCIVFVITLQLHSENKITAMRSRQEDMMESDFYALTVTLRYEEYLQITNMESHPPQYSSDRQLDPLVFRYNSLLRFDVLSL